MSALTKDRNTPRRTGEDRGFPVGAAKKIFAGSIVVLNAGLAEAGSTANGLVAVGVSEDFVDNSAGGAGDETVRARKGVFHFANSANADKITLAEVGSDCYLVDDQTVAKTNGGATRSVAGKIDDVDDTGVWVKFQ